MRQFYTVLRCVVFFLFLFFFALRITRDFALFQVWVEKKNRFRAGGFGFRRGVSSFCTRITVPQSCYFNSRLPLRFRVRDTKHQKTKSK